MKFVFITCALVSLWTHAPQDVAAMIALRHAEILVGHEMMAFGRELLQKVLGEKERNIKKRLGE